MDFLFGDTARFHSTIRKAAGFTQPKCRSILVVKTGNNVSKQKPTSTSTRFYAFLFFYFRVFQFSILYQQQQPSGKIMSNK